MVATEGMGTCLVQQANGIPCGRPIAEGEAIGTVISAGAGPIVGHKRCADNFNQRKREDTMVKIGQQSGAGGPVDVSSFKDGIANPTPLVPVDLATVSMPEGVIPISSVPFDDPNESLVESYPPHPERVQLGKERPAQVDQATTNLSKHELAVIKAFREGGSKAVQQLELKREQVKHTITIPLKDVPDETTVLEIRLVWPS